MACSGDSVLTSYEGSADDGDNLGTTGGTIGQSFQVPNDATICAFSVYGGTGTVGERGTFKFELLSGSINGTVIATTGSIADSLFSSLWTSPAWNKFEFTSTVELTGGTTYYLKATALTGSINDVFRFFSDTTSPSYANGQEYRGTTGYATRDKLFRIHGVEGGGDPPANTTNFFLMM